MGGVQRASGDGPADFYDDLAAGYHRLYPDWEAASRAQGDALHRVLTGGLGPGPHRVLDAAVGIGTQLLGLARHGHQLSGTDLSRAAVRRAKAECTQRQVVAALGVADMRALPFAHGCFDAVVCADNAVPHLMSTAEVTRALREMGRVTRPGGLVVVTTRDYDQARRAHPPGTLPQVCTRDGGTTVTVQVWDWREDGERYDLQHFQLVGAGHDWQVVRRRAAYWAVTRDELAACAESAGFANVAWHLPEDTGFFQPLMTGRVPA